MVVNQPHFLLFTDAHLSQSRACAVSAQGFGRWHFVLERLDGPERLEAADSESDVHRDRLALLAVVRGLEALEQPSQVTLVTTSRYVSRGLRYGLNEWREAEYTWEHFGIQKPIRNADLWQRIDRAMSFHQVTCRLLQSPLVQAMVETATELDELTILTNPIDAPFDIAADRAHRANENQTAAALVRREPAAGLIQRVDSAHGSIGLGQTTPKSIPASFGIEHALAHHSLAAVQSPIVQHESALITDLDQLNELTGELTGELRTESSATKVVASPFLYRRPRISITLPNLRFQWMQMALEWLQSWRTRFFGGRFAGDWYGASWWTRAGFKRVLTRAARPDSRPSMAPT